MQEGKRKESTDQKRKPVNALKQIKVCIDQVKQIR